MNSDCNESRSNYISRRTALAGAVGTGIAALAGCSDFFDSDIEPDDENRPVGATDDDDALRIATTGPALWDFTRQIADDNVMVFDVIPTGEHSEEYEPTTGDLELAEEADAFVYMRSWVGWMDDFAEEHDDGDTVEVIDASEDIDFYDSHVEDGDEHWWMDPIKCQNGVDNIADGLSNLDPDNADEYEANAADYNEKLDELHDDFEALADSAEVDHIVLGTHNSFGWWAPRYDITVVAPVGLDPDTQPSASDLEEMEETIEEYDLDHVLYDLGEPARAAEGIAEGTGANILPISPIETQMDGTPPIGDIEMSSDWTYFDHFREVNFPSMRKALRAE